MSANAKIKLDLDTTGARASLDGLDRKIAQSARAAQSGLGGRGSLLSSLLGMGAGGLSATAVAGMVGAPIAADAFTVAQGLAGTTGSMISNGMGLAGWAGNVSAAQRAQQQTIQALGPAAAGMSESKIREVYEAFLQIAKLMAAGETKVKSATNVEIAAEAFKPILDKLDKLVDAITSSSGPRMATGGSGRTPGAGR